MRATLSLCFILFLSTVLCAQDLVLSPLGETLCSPGVTNKAPGKGVVLDYGINPNINLRPENATSLSEPSKVRINHRFTIKVKAPILNKEKFKMLIGWNYYGEKYNFDRIGNINTLIFNTMNDKHLKSSRLSLYIIKPINHKYYFALKGVASSNGDYEGLIDYSKRYSRFDVATIFGVKKRPNVEWGMGLLFRKNFNGTFPIVPFGIYNHTFTKRWGIEFTIPTSFMGRYNFNEKSMVLFGPQFDSRSYSIDVFNENTNEEDPFIMRRSELRFSIRYDRNIKSWLWMELTTGYVRNFTTRFEDIENGLEPEIVRVDPSNGPYFKFGLFLSPPKGAMKSKR